MNNFKLIESLLEFEEGKFYHIQIIRRRKENPNLKRNNKLVKSYYVRSLEDFKRIEKSIWFYADTYNARAYINLNKKSDKRTFSLMATDIINCLFNDQFSYGQKLFDSACGKHCAETKKKWIVDVDSKDRVEIEKIKATLPEFLVEIPTINGVHLITSPFNLGKWKNDYKLELDVHKNNPTLLYFPERKVNISKINFEIANLEGTEDEGQASDGYHTFNELYDFRKAYNACLFNEWAKNNKYDVHKSKKHHDGEECFGGGWFVVVANTDAGQITNHYKLEDWDLFDCCVREKADEWDGHTAQEALKRLLKLTQY